jgi:hypothetical protein
MEKKKSKKRALARFVSSREFNFVLYWMAEKSDFNGNEIEFPLLRLILFLFSMKISSN